MKSPWQLGFLALAVTGVSTYDYLYFKHYRAQRQTSIQMTAAQPPAVSEEPLLSPLPDSAGVEDATPSGDDGRPFISRDELLRLSRQAYASKEVPETAVGSLWPDRDPFAAESHSASTPAPLDIPEAVVRNEAPAPRPLPAPQCIFSGTYIQGNNKLALVDGTPLSIGDRLGAWQLARIESDFILFEAGEQQHRVELNSAMLQAARRKDAL